MTTLALIPQERIEVGRDHLPRLLQASEIAIDIETETRYNGTGPEKDFGLSYPAPVTVVALAARTSGKPGDTDGILTVVLTGDAVDEGFIQTLREVFQSSKTIIAHNATFDFRGLGKLIGGLTPDHIWDTYVMQRLLSPTEKYGLLEVAKTLGLDFPAWQAEVKTRRGKLHDLAPERVADYGGADARLALRIYEKQQALIDNDKLFELADWECRAMREYCQMAALGVLWNREESDRRLIELARTRETLAGQLAAEGLDKPGSPAARTKYIYETKQIPRPAPGAVGYTPKGQAVGFWTAGGSLSAAADVVEALVEKHAELKALADWLRVDYMIRAITTLAEHAALDGRIHSLITIATETGRRSSGNPNVENLKMETTPDDPAGSMAGLLTAPEGAMLIEIDFSNAENWVAAMLSADSNLAKACADEDFHSAMASHYFPQAWQVADAKERKRLRRMGKSVTFGTAYGMGAERLALQIRIGLDEAKAILLAKDNAFPNVATTKRKAAEKAEQQGYINLWTGRAIPVDAARSYIAWNYCCQGAVGEMVKRAIVLIGEAFRERGWRSRVAIDMHDALILEVWDEERDAALALASDIMEHIIPEKFNQRTTPNIRWIARPNLAENAKKWGKGSAHEPEPEPTPEKSRTRIRVDYEDMAWSGELELETEPGAHGSRCTVESLRRYYTGLLERIGQLLTAPQECQIPGPNGGVTTVQLDLINWAKVPYHWVRVADTCNTEELAGMDREFLEHEGPRRVAWLSTLQERYNTAQKWLSAVGKE